MKCEDRKAFKWVNVYENLLSFAGYDVIWRHKIRPMLDFFSGSQKITENDSNCSIK